MNRLYQQVVPDAAKESMKAAVECVKASPTTLQVERLAFNTVTYVYVIVCTSCIHVCVYTCMCVRATYMYVCASYIHVCVLSYIHVCVYTCMFVQATYMYVCMSYIHVCLYKLHTCMCV